MRWTLRWLLWAPVRILLSLRYWVRLDGKSKVFEKPGPYLILPNHPAFIDPPNLIIRLWPAFRFRPMLLESNFTSPILAPFAWLLNPIRIPDTDRASAEVRERAGAAVATAIAALKAGENVIVWPSGRLTRDGAEHLGGARTVADVLTAVPEATVVLVRTRGLWGSMFSHAWGIRPALLNSLIRGMLLILANLIVLTPRRRVTVSMQAFAAADRPAPTREGINHWMEEWFNADVPRETPTFVPYHFVFGPRTHEFPPAHNFHSIDLSKVKPATIQAVAEMIGDKIKRPLAAGENRAETSLSELGLDSLDTMEVSLQVEQRFGFTSDVVPTSVGQLWALAEGLTENAPPKPPPAGWFTPRPEPHTLEIVGDTIPQAILHQAFRHKKELIAADDLAGGVTYEKLVVGAWAMAGRFREITGPNVGLMLPAAVACDVALLGLMLAGKLPVLLNWTTGPGNLEHAAKVMGLTTVVTSKSFIDRIDVAVPGTRYLFLEEVRGGLGRLALLRRLLAVRWFGGRTKARLLADLNGDKHAPAVVLFTSGSEKAPKAVPLTHDNILSNQRAVLAEFNLLRTDSVLGFLPMFHSFGMTVTGLLPLTTAVRVVHHPDPTDASALVRKAAGYKPTLIAGTPTFMGYILDRPRSGELDSLRLIVFGAERCPKAVFEKVRTNAVNAQVVEGYGITECSPVVSVHRPGKYKAGTLGPPLLGVEVCAVGLESDAVLPVGEMGMLHVCGPNVFPGYLGYDGPSPFREIGGKRWYITGDLGLIDEEGFVVFRGRLKRFLKAGGEMISLPALEEPFSLQYPPSDLGPRVAVEGVETPDGRRIVLFTTEQLNSRDAAAVLQANGFRGVMRIDEVRHLDAIPVLGTGKTDYKRLRAMIEGGTG